MRSTHRSLAISGLLAAALLAAPPATVAWQESDFPPRPATRHSFSADEDDEDDVATLIGEPRRYTFARGDTLYDVARHVGLGINEVTAAFPAVDVWLPEEGATLELPTFWVLPDGDLRGVVVNIPEMRLYYFPKRRTASRTVLTYPVGLGRDDWQTPTGRFTITEKTVNPTWVIPESIRAEHIRDRGDHRRAIAGGHRSNPLGGYRMRLSLPLYGIHGTNVPWGVGMKASHGCVRLYPEDIEPLFALVPVGTPGEFVYQPVKIGARDGDIYVEVHADIYETGFDYAAAAEERLGKGRWSALVDPATLAAALESKRGVPTLVSKRRPAVASIGGDAE